MSVIASELSGSHRKTYEHLFAHPMPGNLDFRDVLSMLKAVPDAAVDEAHDGHVKVSRGGQSLTLRRPKGKDLSDKAELTQLKHFLEQSGTLTAAAADAASEVAGKHLLAVIDFHEARVFAAEMAGTVPQTIEPYDPFGHLRELRSDQTGGSGTRQEIPRSYYDAVAKTLAGAEKVLLFGSGTGSSSAVDQFMAEISRHHKDVADKVVGTVKIDEHHLTDGQLLAKAREFFAGH